MEVIKTELEDLLIVQPRVFHDDRGYFFESYNARDLPSEIANIRWVQDNESSSTKGVLRGLHYQTGDYVQAKLVRAICGEIYDVVVDLRIDSDSYGRWFGIMLSGENKKQLFIPRGFAHGFLVLSDKATFAYKCDNFYSKEHEAGISFNDQQLKIQWPINTEEIILSQKDLQQPIFGEHLPI